MRGEYGSDNTVSFGDDGDSMMPTNAFLKVEYTSGIFDTGEQENPYPSISGIHYGSIILNHTIVVNKTSEYNATGGKITCTKFTDANGEEYYNGIAAIRLF